VQLRYLRRLFNFIQCRAGLAVADVLADGGGKEESILMHDAHIPP
jgi:hypothetical protein